ncbi:MAG: helix-turn-helix domain-containing protein [Caldilineaceae bacterium]
MTNLQLVEKETTRDIGQEILDAVREIKTGGGRRFQVEVPAAVEARHNVGLSQAEFAKLLGVSKRTIQEWEQGRREPSGAAQSLIKIAMNRPDVLQEVLG